MIGYTIKTKDNIKDIVKKEMKDNPIPFSLFSYIKINGKQPRSSSGSDPKYLNGYTYINSDSIDIGDMNLKNSFNVDLNVKNIYGVIGNWNLKFSVSKDEISKHTKVFEPNAKVKFEDALVNVEKVSFTPINTTIRAVGKYNKEEYKNPEKRQKAFNLEMLMGNMMYDEWFVLDDKGNEIACKGHFGDDVEDSPSKDFYYDLKFVSLKNIPKYLTVIPYRTNFDREEYKKYKSPDGSTYIPSIYKNI
ncbi:ecf-type sigma factor negative effector [Clostridium botulinum H04402 065]|nr:ecf-type sigma factor negative effector [Clostridium botulinum H04402 065]